MSAREDQPMPLPRSEQGRATTELQSTNWKAAIELHKPFPVKMKHSDATALRLVKLGGFGADLIRFERGGKVGPHTHVGDHILVCWEGKGLLWFNGVELELSPGVVYMVPGDVPHAVYAHPESDRALVLFAIGNDHRPADSNDRLDTSEQEYEPSWKT